MTIERRTAWDGSRLAANGGDPSQPDEALHNSAVVGSGNAPADDAEAGPPPKGGAGSGVAEWRAYAESIGLDVSDDDSRDDIIAAVEAHEA